MPLSQESLESLSSMVRIEGTGESFRTPIIYRFLEKYVPSLLRTVSNVHILGAHKVPRNGPVIFCGNHLSNLDPFIKILSAQRPIHFLAKEGHFQKQPNRFVMISTGQIETFRESGGKDALDRAVDVIANGGCLGVFPEGTRSRNTEPPYLQSGKSGFARLSATFPEVPIVPITLNLGAREFMPPGSILPRPWKRIEVIIDDPITFHEWVSDHEGGALDDSAVSAIIGMGDEERNEALRKVFRKFTDQLIGTLRMRGAP